jgi:hypothetical protein
VLPLIVVMQATLDPAITYVLPIRSTISNTSREFRKYLEWIRTRAEVIVVDGSVAKVFNAHESAWGELVRHVAPHHDLRTPMGKVGGVLTGVRLASHERIIIADEDVRYDAHSLSAASDALNDVDVVRPQNFFHPLPWHARWDTARTLLNRLFGGDWPGTLGIRKSILSATRGYDGSVMFENFELVRTVIAAGGTETVLSSAFVKRLPSTASHFWSQRIRQAYDELARPWRLLAQLSLLPVAVLLWLWNPWSLAFVALAAIALAEMGRWKDGGRQVFPAATSLFAVAWLIERGICSWLAVGSRIVFGGVRYNGSLLRQAATPMGVLLERHRSSVTSDQATRRRSA